MPSYDLLSSEQRERILNEILLDKMEEAEEIRNSLPTGFVNHDDDNDFHDYEEERRREDARREEYNRHEHRPYGHRFLNKDGKRRSGYNRQNNNREKDHITYDKNGKPIVKSYAAGLKEMSMRRRRSNSDEEIIYVGYGSTRRVMKRKDYEEFLRKRRARTNSNKR